MKKRFCKVLDYLKEQLFSRGPKPEDAQDIICPVCGYNCAGNGGLFCIDKPTLVGAQEKYRTSEEYLTKQKRRL